MKAWFWLSIFGVGLFSACGPSKPRIRIEQAWIRPDPQMENAAGYLVIHNGGGMMDALTGVQVSFARMATLHQSVIEGGVHRMVPVDRLEIPAGDTVELRPLSYHVMMMGLQPSLEIGEVVTYTLTFETTGEISVNAEIRR